MEQVVIIGGGYSVNEGIQKGLWSKLEGKEVWSLNSVYKIMPYLPTRQLWVDIDFWNHEIDNMQNLFLKGVELITKDYHRIAGLKAQITQYGTCRDLKDWKGQESLDSNMVFTGRMGLVGAFALGVAILRKYKKIYLLGYDFGSQSLDIHNTHFYQNRIAELNIMSLGAARPEVYRLPDGSLREEIVDWQAYESGFGSQISNVSLISNLPYFPKISYEQFFEELERN